MNADVSKFNEYWDDFVTSVKAELYKKEQPISIAAANLALTDAADMWFSESEGCARWLRKFKSQSPEAGKDIEEILAHKITISAIKHKTAKSKSLEYGFPAIGAIVGAASYFLEYSESNVVRAAVSAISAAVLFSLLHFGVKKYESIKQQSLNDKILEQYIMQLDSYKKRIISIILNSESPSKKR